MDFPQQHSFVGYNPDVYMLYISDFQEYVLRYFVYDEYDVVFRKELHILLAM